MKLEDLPKKQIFNVPDGYFDKLPGTIQARVAKEQQAMRPAFRYTLQYAIPVVIVIAIGIFWMVNISSPTTAEEMLAEIHTSDLVAFLNDSDISTDELIEHTLLDAQDADAIEVAVYGYDLDQETLDIITDEIDLNNL
ncbi:MAG TPA: hypothetical protein VIN08_06780 [Ohtaekwangia sp.]|uniref:hypothetical protein n=1 Tax=Ohtaekwangia sp. TaxID=2066019 RepID=UPI002F9316A0